MVLFIHLFFLMLKCKTFIPTLCKLTRTCRRVLLWSHATHTYLSTKTLIRSSGRFLFIVIARTSLLVPADVSFFLSWPMQTKWSTRTFSYLRHKITCPYKQMFTFLCHSLHRPTRPQWHLLFTDIYHTGLHGKTCPYGHFLFTDIAHTGFLIHANAF